MPPAGNAEQLQGFPSHCCYPCVVIQIGWRLSCADRRSIHQPVQPTPLDHRSP